jgi:hypothetical protein
MLTVRNPYGESTCACLLVMFLMIAGYLWQIIVYKTLLKTGWKKWFTATITLIYLHLQKKCNCMLFIAKGNAMIAQWPVCVLTAHEVLCSCQKFLRNNALDLYLEVLSFLNLSWDTGTWVYCCIPQSCQANAKIVCQWQYPSKSFQVHHSPSYHPMLHGLNTGKLKLPLCLTN